MRISDPDKNGKGYPIKANDNIPPNHIRMLDVTDQINDPKQNVIDQSPSGATGLLMAYAQSFLREELGKMYRGELVLRGIPEIEPLDVLLVMDTSTGMMGPIEVETVTHVMNYEDGFITIVKPRALVAINEAASAQFPAHAGDDQVSPSCRKHQTSRAPDRLPKSSGWNSFRRSPGLIRRGLIPVPNPASGSILGPSWVPPGARAPGIFPADSSRLSSLAPQARSRPQNSLKTADLLSGTKLDVKREGNGIFPPES